MLPALACGKGDLAESLKVEAYHPRMGKVVQETVRLEAPSERPPAVDALEDFVGHAPDLKARALERCVELQRLLRGFDAARSRASTKFYWRLAIPQHGSCAAPQAPPGQVTAVDL